jgi:hypothetical protein
VLAVLSSTLRDIKTRRLDPMLSPLVILMLSQMTVALAALGCTTFETWAGHDAVLVEQPESLETGPLASEGLQDANATRPS